MAHMTDLDIEAELIDLRICLEKATAERLKYDGWKHNLCFMSVRLSDGSTVRFASYSNQSSLSAKNTLLLQQQGYEFVPTFDYRIELGVNCRGMGGYHTEPKLFRTVLGRPGLIEHVAEIVLASEIDVCRTCMTHTIQTFQQTYPKIPLVIRQYGMNPGLNRPPTYSTFKTRYGFDPFED